MRRPHSPARSGAPASPTRAAARLISPLPPLLPPRRVPGREGRLRGTEVGAAPAPRSAAVRGVPPPGAGAGWGRGGGETRAAGRPFQGRRAEGARVCGRRDPAARTGTVPMHALRRRPGPLRARFGRGCGRQEDTVRQRGWTLAPQGGPAGEGFLGSGGGHRLDRTRVQLRSDDHRCRPCDLQTAASEASPGP